MNLARLGCVSLEQVLPRKSKALILAPSQDKKVDMTWWFEKIHNCTGVNALTHCTYICHKT